MNIEGMNTHKTILKRRKPCPGCQSKNILRLRFGGTYHYKCWDCGHTWQIVAGTKKEAEVRNES